MHYKKSFLVMTAISASLASFGVCAEEMLGDVVVSAARFEQSTLDAPANVTVVKSDTIEASGARSVGEALSAKVPGFYMRNGTGITTRAPIQSMRGQSAGRVKMMVDGMNLADGNTGGLISLTGLTVSEIQQIEVVPGIGSALYGSDAVGGVVNVISKVPTKQEVSARYTRGFGDGERNEYEATYRNRWESGLSTSINIGYMDVAGYADKSEVVLPVGTSGTGATAVQGGTPTQTSAGAPAYIVGNNGPSPAHQGSINAKFYYELDASSRFFAGIGHLEAKTNYSSFNNYLTKNGAPLALPASNLSIDGKKLTGCSSMSPATVTASCFWNSSSPNYREETRYFAGYDGKVGNDLDLKTFVNYFDRNSYYVSAGTGATLSNGPGTANYTPNTSLEASAQLGSKIGQSQYAIVGLSSTSTKQRTTLYGTSSWRDPENSKTGINEQSFGDSMITGVFAQDQIFLSDAATLYLGGRYDKWTTSGVTRKYVGSPLGTIDSPERSESAFSPKIAGVYRWSETMTFRSSIGSAFRAPSNFELYSTPLKMGTRLLVSDSTVKPETATSWDLGVEKALPGSGSLKAAYYYTRVEDLIYRVTSPYSGSIAGVTTVATSTNAGAATVKGIELSAEIPLNNWLRGFSSFSYTDSRITKDDSNAGLVGKRLRTVPKTMGSLALDAQWQQWRAFLSSTYTGTQFSDETNTDINGDVPGGISSYWLSNLRISYQIDKNFKASLMVSNLFDKKYYESDLMPGRNASLTLSSAF
jgi:iron complex outermembrane receptor protein